LVGSIYGRSFIKIAHFVPIHSNFIFFDFFHKAAFKKEAAGKKKNNNNNNTKYLKLVPT
jgi:hypothetical protein